MELPIFLRVTELSRLSGTTKAAISLAMKQQDRSLLEITGSRIVGISPELVQKYLTQRGLENIYRSGLFVLATQTGGAGKTSSCVNMAISARRITGRKQAIVLIDGDSQASLSLQVTGATADDEDPVLVHWLEGKCKAKDLLTEVAENTYVVRSNLNNIYLDRAFSKPGQIKTQALRLVQELFELLGTGTKIFVDTPPQLSVMGQSFVCAVAQLKELGHLLIPVRPDIFGLKGARICLTEAYEALEAFGISPEPFNATVFLSSLDQRTSTSVKTLAALSRDDLLAEYLSPVAIRHSAEVTKASYRYGSVFNDYKNASTIGSDYTDLLLTTLGWEPEGTGRG